MVNRPRKRPQSGLVGFGFTRQRKGRKRSAMKRAFESNNTGPAGKGTGKFQGIFHRLRPGIG